MSVIDTGSELVVLYLSESGQLIRKFERLIMESEQAGELAEPQELFRILHTIKGTAAMMEFAPLVELAHSFEDILTVLKADPQSVRGEGLQAVVDAGLEFSAYFNKQLAGINNAMSPCGDGELEAMLRKLAAELGLNVKKAPSPPKAARGADRDGGKRWLLVRLKSCTLPHIRASVIARSASKLCSALVTEPENIDRAAQSAPEILKNGFELGFVPADPYTAEDVVKKISEQPYVASCELQGDGGSRQEEPLEQLQTVTVAQSLVNSLAGYMNELASAEGAVEEYAQEAGYDSRRMQELLSTLRRTIAEVGTITAQLGTRDVGGVFMQMRRAVRGMAREQHKDIRVDTAGSDIQVDKSILELLSDSLIHIVRNAVDHGIEAPDEREARGKQRTGHITLSAVKKNGYLTVTVSDDGAGVNRRAVLDKAERQGKLTKPKEQYTDGEAAELLLYSGLSTNAQVTRYSGRGVGLDTVVRRVRQAGGRVALESAEGRGTVFTINVPITLLMLDGVEVTLMNGSRLIIPASAISYIAETDSAPPRYEHHGESYEHILFPGQSAGSDGGSGYSLLFGRDLGQYYIRARRVSMMSSYYVKQMPEYIAGAMGKGYIYSGCAVSSDAGLLCVLDAARLIAGGFPTD